MSVAEKTAALVSTGHLLALVAAFAAPLLLLRSAVWIAVRDRPRRLSSLTPALLLKLAGCGGVLFAVLTVAVVCAPGSITSLDAAASTFLVSYRVSWLQAAFLWLTALGTGAALTGIAVTATGFLWVGQRGALILPLWVTFAGAEATAWIGKFAVGRARPVFLDGVASAVSPSFPSAHATGSTAVLGFVAYAVASGLCGRRERFEITFWAAVLVALISLSRVFLGVHFATDVAGGFLLGGSWLLVGLALAVVRSGSPPSHSQ